MNPQDVSNRLREIARRWTRVGKTGNWSARKDAWSGNWSLYTDNAFGKEPAIEGQIGEMYSGHEAQFVAHAPADIAWLIAEVKRLSRG